MSARSGQKMSVIPIQAKEHRHQQYVQIWSYLKPRHSVFSGNFDRAEYLLCQTRDTQTFSLSPLCHLLQSAPSLNFRPELRRSAPVQAPVMSPRISLATPNTELRAMGIVSRHLFWVLTGEACGWEQLTLSICVSSFHLNRGMIFGKIACASVSLPDKQNC